MRLKPVVLGVLVGATLVAALPAAAGDQQASVALTARPTVLGPTQNVTLRGAVSNQREGEDVELYAKDCGQPSTRSIGLAATGPGGTFELEFYAGVNTTVTAEWKSAVSTPVELRQKPRVLLIKRGRRLEIGVGNKGWLWRKKVTIQRRAARGWAPVKTVVLANTESSGIGWAWHTAEFRLRLARGSTIRAVLPRAQAKPCYIASVSNTVRT